MSPISDACLRFAVIGYGAIGRAYGAMLQAMPHVSVDCVIDTDRARARAGARALRAPTWSDSAGVALRRSEVDAVVVASPHASHADLTREALDRGLHVLLEAPLALRYPDAQRVLACARASDTVVAVNFWMRAAPGVASVLDRVPRPTFMHVEAVVDPLLDSWQGTAEHGGVLGLIGSHALDLTCFLMRSQPRYVQALGGRHTRRADLADTIAAGIRFANGGLARVIVGEYGRSPRSTWSVWATDGVVTATVQDTLWRQESYVGHRRTPRTRVHHNRDISRENSLRAFVDAVTGTSEPLAGAQDGLRAVQLADAVYEAMRARRRVPLTETPLHVGVGPVYADDSVANRRNYGLGA